MESNSIVEIASMLIPILLMAIPFVVYHNIKSKNAQGNLITISKILNSNIEINAIKTKKFVNGHYKDKKVELKLKFLQLAPKTEIYMIPSYVPQSRSKRTSRYTMAFVTKYICWDSEKIMFLFDPKEGLSEKKKLTRQQMYIVLDKLVEGAQVIEKELPYYDEDAKELKISIAIVTALIPVVSIYYVLFFDIFSKKERIICIIYTIFWLSIFTPSFLMVLFRNLN